MMRAEGFATRIELVDGALAGPWRRPRQMLQEQSYGDHATIHDAATAQALGFRSGTIEGPTHFSQFDPLCVALWGLDWFRSGAISVHFREPVFEGDGLRAFVARPAGGDSAARIWMVNDRGATILDGNAGVGTFDTELDRRRAALKPMSERRVLAGVEVGMRTGRRPAVMRADQTMGRLYPFTLADKLALITEPSRFYQGRPQPWGRPLIPLEMASVLMKYTDEEPPFPVPAEVVSLIADQEIRLHDGPLFVGELYELDQEVVAFSGSRRTESLWIRTRLFRVGGARPVATMLINQASFTETLSPA